jgi:hypothetical protein
LAAAPLAAAIGPGKEIIVSAKSQAAQRLFRWIAVEA